MSEDENFSVEIDRDALYRYRRTAWRGWCIVGGGLFGLLFACGITSNSVDRWVYGNLEGAELLRLLVTIPPLIILATICLTLFLRWLVYGRYAKIYADSLQVRVVGPYLQIIEQSCLRLDRKIHFNQLMDYAIYQDRGMHKCGIWGLRISTNRVTNNQLSGITILGLANAEYWRDRLIACDAEREHRKGS